VRDYVAFSRSFTSSTGTRGLHFPICENGLPGPVRSSEVQEAVNEFPF
jgi:hypothetical protein